MGQAIRLAIKAFPAARAKSGGKELRFLQSGERPNYVSLLVVDGVTAGAPSIVPAGDGIQLLVV